MKSTYKNAILSICLMLFMLGLSFAAVPLYKIFCQKTGFGGTTQVAYARPDRIIDRSFRVRFNADVSPNLPWKFEPLQPEITVRGGEEGFAVYAVQNMSNKAVAGISSYNVTPDRAGLYFRKLECFCFIEQRLEANQVLDMPLLFYIDPAIEDDPELKNVKTITLSYTFFPFKGIIPDNPYAK